MFRCTFSRVGSALLCVLMLWNSCTANAEQPSGDHENVAEEASPTNESGDRVGPAFPTVLPGVIPSTKIESSRSGIPPRIPSLKSSAPSTVSGGNTQVAANSSVQGLSQRMRVAQAAAAMKETMKVMAPTDREKILNAVIERPRDGKAENQETISDVLGRVEPLVSKENRPAFQTLSDSLSNLFGDEPGSAARLRAAARSLRSSNQQAVPANPPDSTNSPVASSPLGASPSPRESFDPNGKNGSALPQSIPPVDPKDKERLAKAGEGEDDENAKKGREGKEDPAALARKQSLMRARDMLERAAQNQMAQDQQGRNGDRDRNGSPPGQNPFSGQNGMGMGGDPSGGGGQQTAEEDHRPQRASREASDRPDPRERSRSSPDYGRMSDRGSSDGRNEKESQNGKNGKDDGFRLPSPKEPKDDFLSKKKAAKEDASKDAPDLNALKDQLAAENPAAAQLPMPSQSPYGATVGGPSSTPERLPPPSSSADPSQGGGPGGGGGGGMGGAPITGGGGAQGQAGGGFDGDPFSQIGVEPPNPPTGTFNLAKTDASFYGGGGSAGGDGGGGLSESGPSEGGEAPIATNSVRRVGPEEQILVSSAHPDQNTAPGIFGHLKNAGGFLRGRNLCDAPIRDELGVCERFPRRMGAPGTTALLGVKGRMAF